MTSWLHKCMTRPARYFAVRVSKAKRQNPHHSLPTPASGLLQVLAAVIAACIRTVYAASFTPSAAGAADRPDTAYESGAFISLH